MRAIVTVEDRRQFEFSRLDDRTVVTHLDGTGQPIPHKQQLTISRDTAPILKPGEQLVYGLADGTIVSDGIITGVLVRR